MGFRRRWKAPRSPRNRRLSRGGGGRRSRPASRTKQGALQPLRTARHGDPGARERKPEEGHWSFSTSPSLAAPGPFVRREAWVSAHGQRRAKGSLFTGDPGPIAQARRKPVGADGSCVGDSRAAVVDTRERGGGDREDRGSPVRHGRGSTARGMCPWVVSGCRSRRASPAVQRSRDLLFLNRTRSRRTGPSARRAEPRTRKRRWPRGGASETGTRSGARTFTSRAPCEGPSQCPEPRKGCSEGGRGSPMMEGTSDRGARRPSLGGRAETVLVVSEWLPSKRSKADAATEVPEVRSRGARGEENAPRCVEKEKKNATRRSERSAVKHFVPRNARSPCGSDVEARTDETRVHGVEEK